MTPTSVLQPTTGQTSGTTTQFQTTSLAQTGSTTNNLSSTEAGTGGPGSGTTTYQIPNTTKTSKKEDTIPTGGLIAIIVVIVLPAIAAIVITVVVLITCLWPRVRVHRRKGRGRDLSTLAGTPNLVYCGHIQ